MDIETQKKLVEAIINPNKKEIKPYTTKATVSSVSDGIIYVKLPGSENSTPIKSSSVSVNPGDVVDISVSHDDTHITGNRSDVAAPASTTKQISKALEATRLEMDNTFDLFNNEIKMLNNNVDMQNNEIKMQNNTIEQINNTIEQQNNKITEIGNTVNSQNNKITEIGNTVNSQNNKITEIGNTVNSQGNTITEIGNKVNSQNNKITEIGNTVNSQGNDITELNNTVIEIGNTVNSQGNTITEIGNTVNSQGNDITELNNTVNSQGNTITQINNTINQHNTEIETLNSSIQIINSAFVIQDGKLTGLSEIVTNILNAGYVTTDLLNADVAWIENGKIKEGAIGTVEIADESVTTAKIKDLSADVITTGTLKTECLILTTDEVDPETGEKKVALITALNAKVNSGEGNILDGAVIADDTIEAAKITVVDLNAFGATIGNFHIGTSSMYNGKESLKDPKNGVYLGTDGIALGQGSLLGMTDDSPFRVESDGDFHLGAKDSNYINFDAFTGELDINAKSIKMGSKTVSEIAQDTVDSLEIGGRNLYLGTKDFSGDWDNKEYWSVSSETYKGFTVMSRTSSWNGLSQPVEGVVGETYTFSGYVKKTGGITYVFTDGFGGMTTNHGAKIVTKINEWEHFNVTTTVSTSGSLGFRVENNSNETTYVCGLKLELGNKATDWTPAPEDVEAGINTKLEDYATLEVTNNKISTAVTETKSYADGKASDAVSTAKSYTDQTAASISSTVEGIDGRMTQMEQNADGFTWTIDKTAIVSSVNEYYKSTSSTSLSGGSWSTSQPTWTEGTYIWMRTKNTNGKGVSSYTTPACITGNTGAQGVKGNDGQNATYITVSGTNYDVVPGVDKNYSYISINGTNYDFIPGRGHTLAVINPSNGVVESIRSYDTYYSSESLDIPLNNVEAGKIICLFTADASALTQTSRNILIECGSSMANTWISSRVTHVFIGMKGLSRGNAYEWIGSGSSATNAITAYYTPSGIVLNGTVGPQGDKGDKGDKGAKGDTGANGTDGRGIKSTAITYQAGSSSTSAPTGTWSSSVPSTNASASYMWTKTVITYTDNSTSTSYSVGSTPEGIEVGGRNLALDTGNLSRSMFGEINACDYGTAKDNGVPSKQCLTATMTSVNASSNGIYYISDNYISRVKVGDEVTVSFYAKCSRERQINFILEFCSGKNKLISLTSEWKKFSLTGTVNHVTGPGLAACLYSSYFEVGDVLYISSIKVERGNKATDWTPAPEDVEAATAEAAKVATNYMNFANNGLTIGNMTASTLGKNVLIDSDSVDIRNGSEVLASYGEEIVLKNDGKDTFTIKKSEFLQTIKDTGRMFTGTVSSYSVGHVNYVQSTAILITADTYALRVKYNDGHDDEYFIFESTSTNSIYGWEWVSSNRSVLKLYLNSSQTSSFTVPCVYCDANAVSELTIRGNVVIHNDSDTNGSVKSLPPLIVGIPSSTHLEIDGDEIGAKTDEKTPSHLYLNMEGGNVSFNNNCERAIMIQDGAIFAKNFSSSVPTSIKGRWLSIVDGINEDGDTTFGYGGYLHNAGATHIYGNKIRLISNNSVEVNHTITVDGDIRIENNVFGIFGTNTSGEYRRNFQPCNRANNCLVGYGSYEASEGTTYVYGNNVELKSKNNIKTDCNIVLPNAKAIVGWNTLGTERLNIQPCNGNNNFVLGYGSYSASEGATNIYGNQLNFYTKNYLNSTRPLKVLWSGAHHMHASQTATLSEAVSTQLNGIVLVWSKYSGGAQNYEWNCFFVPKQHVATHSGAGYVMYCGGVWPSYKYVYINDGSIVGNETNSNSAASAMGSTVDNTNHCLRYVYGV